MMVRRLRRAGGRFLLPVLVFLIYIFLLAPILMIVPVSFSKAAYLVFPPRELSLRWYQNFLNSSTLMDALWLSLKLGASVTVLATLVGTLASIALTRYQFPGRESVRTIVLGPMVLPAVVLGIGLLIVFERVHLFLTFWSLLLAHLVITLPYVVRTVSATLQVFDRSLEEAARTLGAWPGRVFRTIVLPLIKPGIIAGAIFAFITSFDELVVSIFLAGPRLSTLPVQIYNYIEFKSDPTIAAISVVLVGFTVAVVLVLDRIVGFTRFI